MSATVHRMTWECICGNVSPVRHDQCPNCGTWGGYWPAHKINEVVETLKEWADNPDEDDDFRPNDLDVAPQEWQPTSEPEWDAALGKGYPLGATILLNGAPGCGKSRAILRHADTIGGCFVSSEMSRELVTNVCRSQKSNPTIKVTRSIESAAAFVRDNVHKLWFGIDSIGAFDTSMWDAFEMLRKVAGPATLVCIVQENAQGAASGGMKLPHWVDVHLVLRKKVIRVKKNRCADVKTLHTRVTALR